MAVLDPFVFGGSIAGSSSVVFQPAAGTYFLATHVYLAASGNVKFQLTDGTTDYDLAKADGVYQNVKVMGSNAIYFKLTNTYSGALTGCVAGFQVK